MPTRYPTPTFNPMTQHLTKTRFVDGWHCANLLWWKVHQPDTEELTITPALRDLFEQGRQVGALARKAFPGGVLIDLPHEATEERLAATQAALESHAPAIFEGAFTVDGVFIAVDVLCRNPDGFTLIEVKSSTKVKNEHIPDVALQTHVLRANGIDVRRVEVMHLNKACRYPDLSNLFTKTDVTGEVEELLPDFPAEIQAQLTALQGPLPDIEIGDHCKGQNGCPFLDRCWPSLPPNHVSTLHFVGDKALPRFEDAGYVTIHDIPKNFRLNPVQDRQRRAVQGNRKIVEPDLGAALQQLKPPLAFLDFESVGLAIPRWPGNKPWQAVVAQFSCHVQAEDGTVTHHEWIADGPEDPRPELVRQMIRACEGTNAIAVYNVGFERGRIKEMTAAFPEFADALTDINNKLVDLLPIVRNHVYHPDFGGRFGLKYVLPVLVPDLSYDEMEVAEGQAASSALVRLMFGGESMSPEEREQTRRNLLEYCKLDTWGLVKLLERLASLAE